MDKVATFHQFFAVLYNSKTTCTSSDISTCLDFCLFPQPAADDIAALNASITIEELTEALAKAPTNKSPGADGLPAKHYTRYGATLLPIPLKAIDEMAQTGVLTDSVQEAIVIVIPKPGKDMPLPYSYPPISLLNTDVKLLARILATTLFI